VSGNCGEITKIFVPYKMILGDVKNPEFRSKRKAFSHKLVEAARKRVFMIQKYQRKSNKR
jgi:hypothetical protein